MRAVASSHDRIDWLSKVASGESPGRTASAKAGLSATRSGTIRTSSPGRSPRSTPGPTADVHQLRASATGP